MGFFMADKVSQTVARFSITCLASAWTRDYVTNSSSARRSTKGTHLQTEPVTSPTPARGLRPGALLVSGAINLSGALLVILAMPEFSSSTRMASAWALIQFLSGVWAGVLGANSPFLHGLIAGLPALVLGIALSSALPAQYVVVTWFLAPSAALLAAALMRFMRRRT
jgi:hypothetical protein